MYAIRSYYGAKVSLTSSMRARFSARSTYRAIQKLFSAKRDSKLLKYPGILGSAALRRVDDERSLAQRDASYNFV